MADATAPGGRAGVPPHEYDPLGTHVVASEYGLTKNGVRYLEAAGVIKARRDEGNNYRRFDMDEASVLGMYQAYQVAGLAGGEARDLLAQPPDTVACELAASVERLRLELEHAQACAASLGRLLEGAMKCPEFVLARRPPLTCLLMAEYAGPGLDARPLVDYETAIGSWRQHIPEVFYGVCFRLRGDDGPDCERCMQGPTQTVRRLGLPTGRLGVDLPARDGCLRATLSYSSRDGDHSALAQADAWAHGHGLARADEPVVGQYLHLQRDATGDVTYRVMLWVPLAVDA